MSTNALAGRTILVAEDEPLIALDIVRALRAAGAHVLSAGHAEYGLCTSEHPHLSAAVIDLHLGDGSGMVICKRLQQRGLPFVVYTGYPPMLTKSEYPGVSVIAKPARPDEIITALIGALKSRG
jgi:ActR/RegA family two-component response regulator